MNGKAFMNGPKIPYWDPRQQPLEPPAWKNPDFEPLRKFPGGPLKPAISPTEPWPDPVPFPEPPDRD